MWQKKLDTDNCRLFPAVQTPAGAGVTEKRQMVSTVRIGQCSATLVCPIPHRLSLSRRRTWSWSWKLGCGS